MPQEARLAVDWFRRCLAPEPQPARAPLIHPVRPGFARGQGRVAAGRRMQARSGTSRTMLSTPLDRLADLIVRRDLGVESRAP